MVHSTCGQQVWQVTLCDRSLTRASLSALEMSIACTIKRYRNILFTVYFTYSETRPNYYYRCNVIAIELDCDGVGRVVDAPIPHIYLQNNKVICQSPSDVHQLS